MGVLLVGLNLHKGGHLANGLRIIVPSVIVIPSVSARSSVWFCVDWCTIRLVGSVNVLSFPHVLSGLHR